MPSDGESSRPRIESSVDFPQPDGPAIDALRAITGDMFVLSWLYPRATYWTLTAQGVHSDSSGFTVSVTGTVLTIFKATGFTVGFEITGNSPSGSAVISGTPKNARKYRLAESRSILASETKTEVALISYPVGHRSSFTADTRAIAQRCGYRLGFSFYGGCNLPGRVDAFDVRRMNVDHPMSMAMFQARLVFPDPD